MEFLAVDEINDFEVVAGDWCEWNAVFLTAVKCREDTGMIEIKTDRGSRRLTVADLCACYAEIAYLGSGLYQCVTVRDIDTLTDDERMHLQQRLLM